MNDPFFCCGKSRRTKFCPECGREISGQSPLKGLLSHLMGLAATQRKQLELRKKTLEEHIGANNEEWLRKRVANTVKSLAKYEVWIAELSRVIEGPAT